jgi:hypothetical protein
MMKRVFWVLLLTVVSCEAVCAQNESINELRRVFDYDEDAALDVREVGVINRNGVRIHDITYASPKGGRVTAYLVVPAKDGRFAGVVFGHWALGTRTLLFQFARFEQYFNEPAMKRYAQAGSEPKLVLWYDTGHGLNDIQPLIDRAKWLRRYIGVGPIGPILRKSLL